MTTPPSKPFSTRTDPREESIARTTRIIKGLKDFWSKSHGWAPKTAADLLAAARLDRQLSFAHTLSDYLRPFSKDADEARQILGYTTLRSMCEGALKLFFSVWFEDYQNDIDVAVRDKKGALLLPETVAFDRLIASYEKKVDSKFAPFLRRVQRRGNAIHHFQDKEIGTQEELVQDILEFERFISAVNGRLPYPDDVYNPAAA